MQEGPNAYTYGEPTREGAFEAWITNRLPEGYKGSGQELGCYLIVHLELGILAQRDTPEEAMALLTEWRSKNNKRKPAKELPITKC